MTRRAISDWIAEELDLLHRDVEQVGAALCADPALAREHMALLQRLDEIGQRHHHLATVLRAADPEAAVNGIGLDRLAGRFRDEVQREASDDCEFL